MAASGASGSPADAVGIMNAADRLATHVGPIWALVFVVVILLLLPRWGLLAHLAHLWKEDRADSRKRKIEFERLDRKYINRQDTSGTALPPPVKTRRLPAPRPKKEGEK